jgi:hypothetical protein
MGAKSASPVCLKSVRGDYADTNAGENCGYRFQLYPHAVGNYGEFDRK